MSSVSSLELLYMCVYNVLSVCCRFVCGVGVFSILPCVPTHVSLIVHLFLCLLMPFVFTAFKVGVGNRNSCGML